MGTAEWYELLIAVEVHLQSQHMGSVGKDIQPEPDAERYDRRQGREGLKRAGEKEKRDEKLQPRRNRDASKRVCEENSILIYFRSEFERLKELGV